MAKTLALNHFSMETNLIKNNMKILMNTKKLENNLKKKKRKDNYSFPHLLWHKEVTIWIIKVFLNQ